MSGTNAEFALGASTNVAPISLNTEAPVKSPIKPKDFDGAHPEPWTSEANIAEPPTNRNYDFSHYMDSEQIPNKASINGMV